jgi:hypothetical protein
MLRGQLPAIKPCVVSLCWGAFMAAAGQASHFWAFDRVCSKTNDGHGPRLLFSLSSEKE